MLTVITGPPCSGKSTEARKRHKPGGILIDYDQLAQALGSPKAHDHPDPVRWVTIAARRAAIEAAIKQHHAGAHVIIVQTRISRADAQRYAQAGAGLVTLTADADTLHARADAERPDRWHELIDTWQPEAAPRGRPRTATDDLENHPLYKRGRWGRPYRRWRALVLARSRICHICGEPGADSADHHPEPLASIVRRGGDPLDPNNGQPAHMRCNSAKGSRTVTSQGSRRVTQRGVGASTPPSPTVTTPQAIVSSRW